MKRHFLLALITLTVLAAAGQAAAQTITGSIGKGRVSKGATTRAYVVMEIPAGLHVNSRYPKSKYAIPTTVDVSASGVRLGAVSYPRGKNRKFSFSEDTINIYEGRVVFGFNVIVPRGYRGRSVSVRAKVRYQACTDEVCYAPKTKEITLTAVVR